MPLSSGDLKRDVIRVLAWPFCVPVLACWPFLSAFPGFTLLGEELCTPQTAVNAVLLMRGFWPITAIYFFYLIVRVEP